jgi:hypothetical protein
MPTIFKTRVTSLNYVAARVIGIFYPFSLVCVASAGLVLAGCGGGDNSGTPTSTPRFSPGPGTYTSTQTVTVSDLTIGATVYCTVDGSTPTTSSNVCQQPITVSKSQTINAIATAPWHKVSAVAIGAYVINLPAAATPVFSPAGGSYTTVQTVAISDATSNAKIYYTTDGSTPTTSSTFYSGPVAVMASETLKAIAVQPAYSDSAVASAAYEIQLPTAAPTISTSTGSNNTVYGTPLTVTISDADANAAIFYAIGAPATTSSTRYTGPISVSTPGTLHAIAIDTAGGLSQSDQVSASFTVTEAAPTFSQPAGTIHYGSQVALADADPGATIHYTLDGSAATTSSPVYKGPITVTSAESIHALAVNTASGFLTSAVSSAAYSVPPATAPPVISAAGGATTAIYPSAFTVSISDSASGASIYYTTDGSTASSSHGTLYIGSFRVAQTETVSVIAIDAVNGAPPSSAVSQTFTVQEAAPVFAPPAGTAKSGTQVAITDADPGAAIYYTTDGNAASTSSTRYTGQITLTASEVIHAVAANNASGTVYTQSADVSASYTVEGSIATPTISSAGGLTSTTYPGTFSVSLSDTDSSASIYYTLDGSTPSATNGRKYSGAFTVSSTLTVTAIAIDTTHGTSFSLAASQLFTIIEATPVISPASGTITAGAKVTITDADSGAAIYYSTDSKAATTSSTRYTGPFPISSSTTVNAIAVNTGAATNYTQSQDASASYTVNSALATPVITTAGGHTTATYPETVDVTITDSDTSASIYYTTDGSTPSQSNGTRYAAPFGVGATGTVKAVAVDPAGASAVASLSITITEATPTFLPAAGLISPGASVTIRDADSSATIYYTTDGSDATTSSSIYSSPITIAAAKIIHAVAINTKPGENRGLSAQASASYSPYTGRTISGTVVSGSLPIIGASVHLVAAGVSGYASGSASLTVTPSSVATDSSGGFSLGYTCPSAPGDQLYLVATGGSTVSGETNASIALMTALGSCSNLATNTSATINELTTVASAYSLSGFSAVDPAGGIDVGAPAPSATCTSSGASIAGKSTCNYRGLANAFLTPANLVDPVAGVARTITPFYSGSDSRNPNGWSSSYGDPLSPCPGASCLSPNNPVPDPAFNTSSAPYQRINTLGNVLASCTEEPANCDALFALTGRGKDTLQSALYIAQHPFSWSGTAGLYGLIANPASAFTPPYGSTSSTLNSEPNDWALAITITGAGLGHSTTDSGDSVVNQGIAIDGQGNVWVTAITTVSNYIPPSSNYIRYSRRKGAEPELITTSGYWSGMIAGFDPIGEALTMPTSVVAGTIAYDAANGYTSYGGYGPDLKTTDGLGMAFLNPYSFLIDASRQIWVNNNVSTQSTFPAGPAAGSKVTIAATPAPGSANLALSSTSPDNNFPNTMYSLLTDSSGNLWGSSGAGIGGLLFGWNSAGTPYPDAPWFINFDPSVTVAGTLCNMIFDTNGTMWGDDCGYADDNGQVFAVSLPDTSSASSYANVLGDYKGATTDYSPSGTLAAGAGGNVYACDSTQKQYLVFNTSNLSAPVTTFKPSPGRCGQYLTVDGAGHIWSYSVTTNGPVLDEIDSSGNPITPATGLTGTSPEEQSVTGLALFNGTAVNGQIGLLGGQQGGLAADPSGNLWFLNGETGQGITSVAPANALVEIIGVAVPTVTPTAVATQNGAQGTKP